MKRITHNWLKKRGACSKHRKLFKELYPNGIDVCWKCFQEAQRKGLDVSWLAHATLKAYDAIDNQFGRNKHFRHLGHRIDLPYSKGWWTTMLRLRGLKLLEKAFLENDFDLILGDPHDR